VIVDHSPPHVVEGVEGECVVADEMVIVDSYLQPSHLLPPSLLLVVAEDEVPSYQGEVACVVGVVGVGVVVPSYQDETDPIFPINQNKKKNSSQIYCRVKST